MCKLDRHGDSHGTFLSTTRRGDRPHHVEQVMKPPHCGVGLGWAPRDRSWPAPCVIRAATQKPRHRKGPGGTSAHAVSDVPRTHRKPPCHYAGVLTRALRGPYGADKFAHFDTKNSVLMTWPPGLLGPKVLLAAATSMMPSEREGFAAEQAADRARRVLPPI